MRWVLAVIALASCLSTPEPAPTDRDGGIDAGLEPATCNDTFGDLPGYQLCEMASGSCTFQVATPGTCAAICGELGSECLASFDSEVECEPVSEDEACGVPHDEQMCVCGRIAPAITR